MGDTPGGDDGEREAGGLSLREPHSLLGLADRGVGSVTLGTRGQQVLRSLGHRQRVAHRLEHLVELNHRVSSCLDLVPPETRASARFRCWAAKIDDVPLRWAFGLRCGGNTLERSRSETVDATPDRC